MTEQAFWNRNNNASQEIDKNGYYSMLVTQLLDQSGHTEHQTQSMIKTKNKIVPAHGTEEIRVGIMIDQNIVTPIHGFTVLMSVVYITHEGDVIQALLRPDSLTDLIAVGANYVESVLVTIPFAENDYTSLRPGSKFMMTVDLYQPPVESEDGLDGQDPGSLKIENETEKDIAPTADSIVDATKIEE